VFLLRVPQEGVALSSLKSMELHIDLPQIILFEGKMELPAYVALRAMSYLGLDVTTMELYEFLFSWLPYNDPKGRILLLAEEERKEFLDAAKTMNLKYDILQCTENLTLCDLSLSLSLLKLTLKNARDPRSARLLEQLNDLRDLDEWAQEKVNPISDQPSSLVLSPVLKPAKRSVSHYSGIQAMDMWDHVRQGSVLLYTGVDSHLARRELSRRKEYVNSILIDSDPVLAPLYATIVAIKLPKLNKR